MKETFLSKFSKNELIVVLCLITVKILINLLNPEYGYHRDELYYICVGDNFSFSNLEMLPLSPLYLKLITLIFGYSVKAIHFASALCGALSILFSCMMAKELGGKIYSIFLTGLLILFSRFLIFGSKFTYDSLDFLIWVMTIYFLLKIFKYGESKLWIVVGVILGLGLLNKLTILFLGLAIFVSLWFVPQRKYFKEKWIWIGGVIAIVFSLPYIIW
jgi:4-amino-4-deoxy-L-arabinose transferase-like glycosyltransferase